MKRMQYTIRDIPEHIDQELRRRALAQQKSLSAVAIEALEQACRIDGMPQLKHDLDEFSGSWVEDPEFDEAIKEFERIDEEIWK